jgi:uncharacterized protein (TIGR02271 family)
MNRQDPVLVVDKAGVRGQIESSQFTDPAESGVLVRFGEREVYVPAGMLVAGSDGVFHLPVALSELAEQADSPVVLPVIEEEVQVQTRKVETGGVRVTKLVHEKQETIDLPLLKEEIEVKRVAINRPVDQPMQARQEGDTLIIPLVEEVLVVQRQLVLKEEVHIITRRARTQHTQQETVRSEEVVIEPLGA